MSNQCQEDTHITEDGSLTLKDGETGELYHNRAGAYTEALANFVEPLNLRALASRDKQLAFLDVCFGLGYNTFVLLNELMKLDLHAESIKIVAMEKFQKPLLYIGRVLSDLRFESLHRQIEAQAPRLQSGAFGRHTFSLPCASRLVKVDFELLEGDLRDLVPPMFAEFGSIFDGIFHDPFSPRRAPELWSIDLFDCYRKLLFEPTGKVVTYSSASAIRSAFQQCGMIVRRTAALGGKSGGTLAMLSSASIDETNGFSLFEEEAEKLVGRAGVPYRDPGFCNSSKEILHAREQEQRLLFPY
jgi:tRNA U34 5-methylaminomethyl-2-thiouridine-forming methyltransferase MnmC